MERVSVSMNLTLSLDSATEKDLLERAQIAASNGGLRLPTATLSYPQYTRFEDIALTP